MVNTAKIYRVTLIGILLSLVIFITFTGCSPKPEVQKQELNFLITGSPLELDPTQTNESFATPIIYHVFEPLLREDASGSLAPALAEKWEV